MLNTCAQAFVDLLESKGLNFQSGTASDGDSIVDFPYQGKVTKMIFSGENGCYLSNYLVFERVPDDKLADVIFVCNDLNCQYKWITFYVDKDNDVVLHDDAILSAENASEEAFELLIRMVQIGEEAKPMIMKAIYA